MKTAQATKRRELCVTDRRDAERRKDPRRTHNEPVAGERRAPKERRDGGERRRQIDPTTCERDYSEEDIIFMRAMDHYKRANRRQFPTWSEVLEVLHALGYRKIAEPSTMPGLQTGQPRKRALAHADE